MKTPALILTVMATTLLMSPASSQDKEKLPRQGQIEESAQKIKELRKVRIATLQQVVDVVNELFRNGRVSFEEVCEAKLQVLKEDLQATDKASERVTLYKKFVDVMKEYETMAEERVKTAQGTVVAVLKVKSRRLEAEILLEQAKIEEAKENK